MAENDNDPLAHVKEEAPRIHALLTGAIEPTKDLLDLAVDYTWLRHEYSERCDGEDFPVDTWETIDGAIKRADAAEDPEQILEALRVYWTHWRRYSTIY